MSKCITTTWYQLPGTRYPVARYQIIGTTGVPLGYQMELATGRNHYQSTSPDMYYPTISQEYKYRHLTCQSTEYRVQVKSRAQFQPLQEYRVRVHYRVQVQYESRLTCKSRHPDTSPDIHNTSTDIPHKTPDTQSAPNPKCSN